MKEIRNVLIGIYNFIYNIVHNMNKFLYNIVHNMNHKQLHNYYREYHRCSFQVQMRPMSVVN